MLISKTPLRVSFLGGGTDFPWFFEEHGGAVVSAAVNQHIYISCVDSFDAKTFYLKYSRLEVVTHVDEIQHPIFRFVLADSSVPPQDISVMAEIPAGNGLASSSAFTVGLVNLISRRSGELLSPYELARRATHVEIDQLNEPIGVQDQLGSAFAGVNFHKFGRGRDIVSKGICQRDGEFPFDMLLVKVGTFSRQASKFTELQKQFVSKNPEALRRLIELRDLTLIAGSVLADDLSRLPEFIKTGWELKVASNQNAMTDEIRAVGQRLETLGSLAWKLLGAGGGGFVLALYEKGSAQRVVSELTLEGKQVIVLGLDLDGSKTFEV